MDLIGLPSFHARVESWETDFNGHWNTRFYARCFQMAAESVAAGDENPGAEVVTSRHIRFHRELFTGAGVEVRSATIAQGRYAGAVVHLLYESGRIAATALDLPGIGAENLAPISPEALPYILPRGLDATIPLPWREEVPSSKTFTAKVGTVMPSETDHTGRLTVDEMIKRCAHGYHDQLIRLGFTPGYTRETGVGRMLAEMRTTLLGHCTPGERLSVSSRLVSVGAKSFTTAHYLQTRTGNPVALFELVALAVDMNTRRVTEVPGWLSALSPG